MTEPASIANTQRLEMAVAEFLECLDRGESPNRAALLLQYADVAAELGEFFTDHDRIEQFARPAIVSPLALVLRGEGLGVRGSSEAQQAPTISHQPTPNCDSDTTWQVAFESQPSLPTQIGPYEILAELGRGGMGIVYRARHTGLDREVALKTILAGRFASPEDLSRFRAEATAAATLDHQGIVPIFDMGQVAGQPYFAMPLIQGQNLAQRLKSGALPPPIAVKLLAKIAAAVAYAHARGVIHRDLKPGNILLAPGPSEAANSDPLLNCDPKITDFGLAKRLGIGVELTASGQILGTPSYMPPEQASGKRHEIGPAADIYALGAILYAMLTGRPPFHSDNPVEAILQVIEREPPLPRSLQPTVPQELEWICLKCLEKKPADRYASATDLLADLERFLRHEPPLARPPNIAQRLRRWVRRKPILAAHWIGLSASLLLGQLVYLVHPERDLAYHTRFCGVQIIWLIVSLLCQRSLERNWTKQTPLYLWAAADAALLTWLLTFIEPPLGLFIGGYCLLIAVSGLASSTRLVIFTTTTSLLAFLALLLLRPELRHPLHYPLFAALPLALSGLAIGYQVWRINVLRDYYGDRPGA